MSTSAVSTLVKPTQSAVTAKQSQKLVQTMLFMSFGCITYLRGLFDEGCFNDQKYYPNKTLESHGKGIDSSNSIRVKTLRRGKSKKIDSLLDWLDKGVFPLINSKYLKALSFSIYLDADHPLDLAEAYTFNFSYENDEFHMNVEGRTSSGVQSTTNPFSLVDSRKAVEQLMRKLIVLTQSFPSLPLNRNLSIRLLFNDNCPLDYQPSDLFKDISQESQPRILLDKLDLQENLSPEKLITPFHHVGFKVLSSCTDGVNSQNLVEMDPFELCDDVVSFEIPSRVTTLYKPKLRFHQSMKEVTPSQVTSELESIIRQQSASSIQPTQVLEEIENFKVSNEEVDGFRCECNSRKPIGIIEFKKLQCPSCHKNKHVSCYGFELNFKNVPQDFKCYTCRSLESDKNIHPELLILMNVRKIYRLINKIGIPESISSLILVLGINAHDEKSFAIFIKAINVLVYDGILEFTQDPIRKAIPKFKTTSGSDSSSFAVGSGYTNVDVEGISDGIKEIQLGKSGLTFTPLVSRHRRPVDENALQIVKERREFYFNQTLSICFEEEISISQSNGVSSEDSIVESQKDLDLFEHMLITKKPETLKRPMDELIEGTQDSSVQHKLRKISGIKNDLKFK